MRLHAAPSARGLVPTLTLATFVNHLNVIAWNPFLPFIAAELGVAVALLGVAALQMLGYRGSGMPGTPANQHPEAFYNADPVEAAGRLVRIIRALRPLVMVTLRCD